MRIPSTTPGPAGLGTNPSHNGHGPQRYHLARPPDPLQVELAAPVYRRLHAARPLLTRVDREGAHPLPSVYDAVPPPAVPAAVRLLVPHQPFEGAPDKSVIGVPELDQRPRGVPCEAEL